MDDARKAHLAAIAADREFDAHRLKVIVAHDLIRLNDHHLAILESVREEVLLAIENNAHVYLCSAIERAADEIRCECDPKDLRRYDNACDTLLEIVAARIGTSSSLRRWVKTALIDLGEDQIKALDLALDHEMHARLAWIERSIELRAM
ncbi:hypothetical protein [Burkholderia phage vB_BglM_WTB]